MFRRLPNQCTTTPVFLFAQLLVLISYAMFILPISLCLILFTLVTWSLQQSVLLIRFYLYYQFYVASFCDLSSSTSKRVNFLRAQVSNAKLESIIRMGTRPLKRNRYERLLLLKTKRQPNLTPYDSRRKRLDLYQCAKIKLEADDAYCFLAEPDFALRELSMFKGYILRDPTYEAHAYTMYKTVDKKVKPVSAHMPPSAYVRRRIPVDPLLSLTELPTSPPEFVPSKKLTLDRLKQLEIDQGFLRPEEVKLFNYVIQKNERALAFEDIERGTLSDKYFSDYVIPTIPHKPWEYKNIPIPPGIMDKVLEVLKLKIDAGVYEPSESSYRSRWFCVVKKNGKLRIVHDLQPLNKVSIRDAGMLPVVDDFVEGFAARQCYTVFDLFWGFDARKVDRESRELTAFMTPLGLLQITSLPTGYTNSPSEFQKCMVYIIPDEIPDYANIFIDDLAIKGPRSDYADENGVQETIPENPGIRRFIWEHANDVHRIMHKIGCAGATFSGSKTQICRPEVLIIGQKCNAQGRSPDTSKVDKITKWPVLTTPKEVRSFLGLAGTMRIWIKNYSELVKPLTMLYHIKQEWVWGPEQQHAFDEIKRLVTTAPVLRPIDYKSDHPLILSVDSSKYATGMILSQLDEKGVRHPARFGSIPMSEREARYSQPKLELFGLFKALKHWRFYIIGAKHLKVEMDAKFVKSMLNEPDLQPNAIINRWIMGVLMFDFDLIHVPANSFRGPDALSRWPYHLMPEVKVSDEDDTWLDKVALYARRVSTYEPTMVGAYRTNYEALELPSCFLSRIQKNEELVQIRHFLNTLQTPPDLGPTALKRFIKKAEKYFWVDDHLYREHSEHGLPQRVVIEPETKQKILVEMHEHTGHRGVEALEKHVKTRFYWPHMNEDISHHVASCHECQVRSSKRFHQPVTVSTPVRPFERIYLDTMRMPIDKYGNMHIICAKDDLTGTVEARALKANTAQAARDFLWEQIYCRYGAPESVTTDNGSEFQAAFKAITDQLRIPAISISKYNSQGNGVVERGHAILRESIVKSCKGNLRAWSDRLPEAVFADRVTVKRVTGYSPYQLLHGCNPLLPLDLMESTFLVSKFHSNMSEVDLLAARIQQLQKLPEDINRAASILKQARFRSKTQFERRFHHKIRMDRFEVGDKVLLRNTPIEKSLQRKQFPRYLGPYQVVRKNRGGAYVLAELDGAILAEPYGAFRLMPYIHRDHWFMKSIERQYESDSGTDSDPPIENNLEEFSSEEGDFEQDEDLVVLGNADDN